MVYYKEVNFLEGEPCNVVGVHPLRWRPEWGDPQFGFTDVGAQEVSAEIAALRRVVEALRDWYPNEVDAALEAEGLEG